MVAERTDGELVHLVRQGDKRAFGMLIERYQAMMVRLAMRMLGSTEAAEDSVQEALLQAYLCLNELREADRFRSWLYGIVLNVCKGFLREGRRGFPTSQALKEDQMEGVWSSASLPQDPQEIAIERELHQLVLAAILELPPAHRQTARMFYYESLTLQEIAAITGASPQAIKVRLHRARNSLRQKLGPAYPEIKPVKVRKPRRKTMMKVKVVDILKRDEKYIVILQDEAGEKTLPIWIGRTEGISIAMGLRAFPTVRPMTYDFILHLLETLGARLIEARVEALKEDTFYGIAKIQVGDAVKEVDARPSDVIALAVRTGSPIYVSEAVMQQASKSIDACEQELGPITSGEGVEAILQEFEQMMQSQQAAAQSKEEEPDSPEPD